MSLALTAALRKSTTVRFICSWLRPLKLTPEPITMDELEQDLWHGRD